MCFLYIYTFVYLYICNFRHIYIGFPFVFRFFVFLVFIYYTLATTTTTMTTTTTDDRNLQLTATRQRQQRRHPAAPIRICTYGAEGDRRRQSRPCAPVLAEPRGAWTGVGTTAEPLGCISTECRPAGGDVVAEHHLAGPGVPVLLSRVGQHQHDLPRHQF